MKIKTLIMEITPDDYKECPLGYSCTKYDEKNEYGRPIWHKCPNAGYCKALVEAWYLPFEIDEEGMTVKIDLPDNYHEEVFDEYMKSYGWAEAWDFPYCVGGHFHFYTIGNELLVVRNEFDYGFAVAIDMERMHNVCKFYKYIIDDQGFWWFPGGHGKPPNFKD